MLVTHGWVASNAWHHDPVPHLFFPWLYLRIVPSSFYGVKSKAIAVLIQPTSPEGGGKLASSCICNIPTPEKFPENRLSVSQRYTPSFWKHPPCFIFRVPIPPVKFLRISRVMLRSTHGTSWLHRHSMACWSLFHHACHRAGQDAFRDWHLERKSQDLIWTIQQQEVTTLG